MILLEEFEEGKVWLMEGLDEAKSDIEDLKHISSCFARMGSEVCILRPVHHKSPEYTSIFIRIDRDTLLS